MVTSEDMDGPGRDIVVDNLMSRTFRNLLARPVLATEIITNSELLPGLLDLADAVTDIALGNAGVFMIQQFISVCIGVFECGCDVRDRVL